MRLLYEKWLDPEKIVSLFEHTYDLDYYLGYLSLSYQMTSYFGRKPATLRYFDFGMGWGNWLMTARAMGVSVFGSELSEERVKSASRNGIAVIGLDEIRGQEFDFINTDQVFEHLPKPLETLRLLTSGLRKGGVIRICVPDGNSNRQVLAKMNWAAPKGTPDSLNIVAPLEHINCFTTKSIVTMATKEACLEWLYVPKYPRLTVERGPVAIDRLAMLAQIPRDVARKVYRTVRPAAKAVEQPWGTGLFFVKNG